MGYSYSQKMKKAMQKTPTTHLLAAILFLLLFMILTFVMVYRDSKAETDALMRTVQVFDHQTGQPGYSELKFLLLSEEFATKSSDRVNFCFAINAEQYISIVALKAIEMRRYQDQIDYTHGVTTQAPAVATIRGMPVQISDDLMNVAIAQLNNFTGTTSIDATSFESILGGFYLDATKTPADDQNIWSLWLLAVAIALILIVALVPMFIKQTKQRRATLDEYSADSLVMIDREMNQSGALCLKTLLLCITENYLVSSVNGFKIIPLNKVVHFYGTPNRLSSLISTHKLFVETVDGNIVEIASMIVTRMFKVCLERMIDHLKKQAPHIRIGFENSFFSTHPSKWLFQIETDSEEALARSRWYLGVIGAILGAVLGGMIWVAIGWFGFFAGLSGWVIVVFAIVGYRKMAGAIDTKGQIISLIIAYLMIFVAHYFLYMIVYCFANFSGQYTIENLVLAFKCMPEFLASPDIPVVFLIDLVIGYVLSLLISFRTIRTILTKKQQRTIPVTDVDKSGI